MTRERSDRDGLRLQVYAGRDSLTGRKSWVSRPVPGKVQAALKRAKQVEAELLIRSPLAGIAAAGLRRCRSRSNSVWRGARASGRSRRPPSPRIGATSTAPSAEPRQGPGRGQLEPPPWTPSTSVCVSEAVGRPARLFPADEEVGAEEVEAGYLSSICATLRASQHWIPHPTPEDRGSSCSGTSWGPFLRIDRMRARAS